MTPQSVCRRHLWCVLFGVPAGAALGVVVLLLATSWEPRLDRILRYAELEPGDARQFISYFLATFALQVAGATALGAAIGAWIMGRLFLVSIEQRSLSDAPASHEEI
jgi:hypothetical protein